MKSIMLTLPVVVFGLMANAKVTSYKCDDGIKDAGYYALVADLSESHQHVVLIQRKTKLTAEKTVASDTVKKNNSTGKFTQYSNDISDDKLDLDISIPDPTGLKSAAVTYTTKMLTVRVPQTGHMICTPIVDTATAAGVPGLAPRIKSQLGISFIGRKATVTRFYLIAGPNSDPKSIELAKDLMCFHDERDGLVCSEHYEKIPATGYLQVKTSGNTAKLTRFFAEPKLPELVASFQCDENREIQCLEVPDVKIEVDKKNE